MGASYNFASGFGLYSDVVFQSRISGDIEPKIRATLIIQDKVHAKTYYALLKKNQKEIETEFGKPLIWHEPQKSKRRVFVECPGNFLDLESWNEFHEWLRVHLEKLHEVFAPRIKQLERV